MLSNTSDKHFLNKSIFGKCIKLINNTGMIQELVIKLKTFN